jgi:hypothetical protein
LFGWLAQADSVSMVAAMAILAFIGWLFFLIKFENEAALNVTGVPVLVTYPW